MERSRKVDLPWLLGWSPKAGPQGRCTHHPACGILDLQRRNQGTLLPSVYVKEPANTPTVQTQMSTGSNLQHSVFFEGLSMAEERQPFRRKMEDHSPLALVCPAIGIELPRGRGKTLCMNWSSLRPGRPISRHWQLLPYWRRELIDSVS